MRPVSSDGVAEVGALIEVLDSKGIIKKDELSEHMERLHANGNMKRVPPPERRLFERIRVGIPLTLKFLHVPNDGVPIRTRTINVSFESILFELKVAIRKGGFCIQDNVQDLNLMPFLVLNEKMLELDVEISPREDPIHARGRVMWYDFGSRAATYVLQMIVYPEDMRPHDRARWKEFIATAAEHQRTLMG